MLVPAWLAGEAESGGFARGYQAQLDEVYRRNPVGLRAVRLVAGLAGGLPIFGPSTSSGQAAVALVKADGLLERAAAGLLLHGNVFVRLVTDSHDRPAQLHLMRPERVSVVSGADGWPSAYLYRAGGQAVRIGRNDALGRRQVAHLKALDPSDDHYDPDRDYQAGQMRSSGGGGSRDERIEIPAVLTAVQAKQLVEEALARRWRGGDRLRLRLPPSRLDIRPGQAIQLVDSAQAWEARSVSIEGMAVVIEAEAAPTAIPILPAAPGRSMTQPDVPVGRTELALFELPALGEVPDSSVKTYLAGSNSGYWKPAPVEMALAGTALAGMALSRCAGVGVADSVLDPRAPPILDQISTVVIRLVNPAQLLLNADQDALMAGANLAIIGQELIQFGQADQLGEGVYRLSNLLRGRRGTEWAALNHSVGDRFCMIDSRAVRTVELPASAVAAMLVATAHGIGDAAPLPAVQHMVTGESLRPPPPCRLRLRRDGPTLVADWVRRSHHGWAWVDGVGVAGDPFPELYRLSVAGPAGTLVAETTTTAASLNLAELPAGNGETLTLAVSTVGPAALSHPATATFIL